MGKYKKEDNTADSESLSWSEVSVSLLWSISPHPSTPSQLLLRLCGERVCFETAPTRHQSVKNPLSTA